MITSYNLLVPKIKDKWCLCLEGHIKINVYIRTRQIMENLKHNNIMNYTGSIITSQYTWISYDKGNKTFF